MGEQRLINCGACGTPLTHINEPCPNCLPKMAERPPSIPAQQVYDSGIPQMNAELQRLCAALREAEEKLAAERARGARLEQALEGLLSLHGRVDENNHPEIKAAQAALSSGPSALEAVKRARGYIQNGNLFLANETLRAAFGLTGKGES